MIIGLDLLGLARMDDRRIAPLLPDRCAVGCLLGTFGDPLPKLMRLLLTSKVAAVRIHLTNGCGYRNGNAEKQFDPPANDFRTLKVRAMKVEALAKKFPGVQFYVSPRLEHDERDKALVNKWIAVLRAVAPSCVPVISAYRGFVPRGALVEKHGNRAKGDIISNDGDSLFDAPPGWVNRGKILSLGWINAMNGRSPKETKFIPPSKRPNSAFATAADIKLCLELLGAK